MNNVVIKPKKLINLENCLHCKKQPCCHFKKGDEYWGPLFGEAEVKRINELKFGNGWEKSGSSYRTKLILTKEKKDLLCPFFDDEKFLCKIEKQKPLDCTLWPFVFMKNQKETAINLSYYDSKYCQGLKDISAKEFDDYKSYLIRWCKTLDNKKISDISWDFDSDAEFIEELFKLPER